MSKTKDNLARQIFFACGQNDIRASWVNPRNGESVVVSMSRESGLYLVAFKIGDSVLSSMERTLFEAAEDVEKWVLAGCAFPY